MAVVYLAFDPYMGRQVAVKVLLKERSHDENLRSRFKRESRMVASLNHPAIVPVYDFGEVEQQPYLVMRYMEGKSLRERLRDAPLTLQEVAHILNQIAPALDTTHSHNIIHRDLKPSNILFDTQGKAYLADFGLAKFAEGTYTTLTRNDGGMVGTPAYMSPEQIRAQPHLDGRTDIYALGVILFEMLTGRLPFTASDRLLVAIRHLSDPVPEVHTLNLSLPERLSPIISRAMAKNREDRFGKASELAAPFIEAAQVDNLPPIEFPNAPPIILQPESDSGSTTFSTLMGSDNEATPPPLPEWVQGWLASYGAKQDIGRSRTRGTLEDRMRVGNVQTAGGLHLLLAIVADGGGSQQHGHLAAELVINEVFNRIAQANTAVPDEIPETLQQILEQTNRILFTVAQQHREPLAMQSMVALVAIHEDHLFMAHVGNGRIYLLRDGKLRLINRPTPAQPAIANTPSANGRWQSTHSSAIGQAANLQIDLGLYLNRSESPSAARQNQGLPLSANDRLLLCSDGLVTAKRQQQRLRLRRVLRENPPAEAAKILVQDALNRNVTDNVTAVVLNAPQTQVQLPLIRQRPFQYALAALGGLVLFFLLIFAINQSQPDGILVAPGTATQIAQIINNMTASAVLNAQQQAELTTEVEPLIAPEAVPDPGFAVIFAAGEGAEFRSDGSSEWQIARAGDMVRIGQDASVRSGSDRMGVVLSDGAELYLAPEAEIALPDVNLASSAEGATEVALAYGRLLIHYKNADPHDFSLSVPTGEMALLTTSHNVAGLVYSQETAVLEMDCFIGNCLLRNDQNQQLRLLEGRYGTAAGSNLRSFSAARITLYCDLAPTLVACPTPTPAPTQTLPAIVQTVIAATETAAAQTATPGPSPTPSNTATAQPTASVTPLPTITPTPPGGTSPTNPQPGTTNTPTAQPSATSTRPNSATSTPFATNTPRPTTNTPRPSNTPRPATATNTPVPSNTPRPSNTPTVPPTATPRIFLTASPPPVPTPTQNPDT